MFKQLLMAVLVFAATVAGAVDGSKNATRSTQYGSWQVIEFAMKEQLVYRMESDSTSRAETNLTFDFAPSARCQPSSAVMIWNAGRFSPNFADGIMPFSFKIPGQPEVREFTKTAMERSSTWAFFQFGKLTVAGVASANDRGSLALWIPASGDGAVKRSSNIYFALDGFTAAYAAAKQLCSDNAR